MKKLIVPAVLSLLLCFSCAKISSSGLNDANKRLVDSWVLINHPDAQKVGLGVYVLDDEPGTGFELGSAEDFPYLLVSYSYTDLDGNVIKTTDAKLAQQVGTYSESAYYGSEIHSRGTGTINAGMEMMLSSMRVGGTRRALIPGWFSTTTRYDTEQEYLDNVSGTDAIYTITVNDLIKDVNQWQIDSIESYMFYKFGHVTDSLKYGFYYIQTTPPSDTTSFDDDGSVYINYTGQTLGGLVFDTTNSKIAKDSNIYSASKDYEPVQVTLAEEYSDYEMTIDSSSSTLIDAFSYCLSIMRTGEKGICLFYSGLGYGAQDSGNAIKAYTPLRFDIEMIGTEL